MEGEGKNQVGDADRDHGLMVDKKEKWCSFTPLLSNSVIHSKFILYALDSSFVNGQNDCEDSV